VVVSLSSIKFIDRLVAQVPELLPTYTEHLLDNDQLLPHVLLGDVTRFVVGLCHVIEADPENSDNECQTMDAIIALMEEAIISGDQNVQELVGTSFVENLADNNCLCLEVHLKPALKRELHLYMSS